MSEYFLDPERCPEIHPLEGLKTRILTGLDVGDRMMMVLSSTAAGATVPLHTHPNDQFGMVYAGQALLRIGGEERAVEQGDFYRIPAGVPHGDTALGDGPFVMLDIFYPVRESFIALAAPGAPPAGELGPESGQARGVRLSPRPCRARSRQPPAGRRSSLKS